MAPQVCVSRIPYSTLHTYTRLMATILKAISQAAASNAYYVHGPACRTYTKTLYGVVKSDQTVQKKNERKKIEGHFFHSRITHTHTNTRTLIDFTYFSRRNCILWVNQTNVYIFDGWFLTYIYGAVALFYMYFLIYIFVSQNFSCCGIG